MPATLPIQYRLCRMFRSHAWEDFTPRRGSYRPPRWGTTFHFRCTRCPVERHDTIDARGELAARRYVYPEDYQLPAEDVPTVEQLRLLHVADLRAARAARRRRARGA